MARMAWYDTAQISKLEKARNESDWFTAIVLSATQLERHGYLEIKEYLESLNVNSRLIDRLLEKTYLSQIAGYLLAIKKIDEKEYRTVMKINDARNKFLHRRKEEKFERGAKAKGEYEPLVNEAIRILKEKLSAVRLLVSR